MSNELQLRIGDVIESKLGTFKVADIVDEQWYPPFVVLLIWTTLGWRETSLTLENLEK